MKKMEQLKKFMKEHEKELHIAMLGGCIAGYIGISIWEAKNLKTVYVKDWNKVTGEGPFDILQNKPISGAFATVEYADNEIGIINLDSPGVMDELYSLIFPGE